MLEERSWYQIGLCCSIWDIAKVDGKNGKLSNSCAQDPQPSLLYLADAFFKWTEAPGWRWGSMLLLAIYAAMDFSAQYLLAATPLPTVLPPDVREFLKVWCLIWLARSQFSACLTL